MIDADDDGSSRPRNGPATARSAARDNDDDEILLPSDLNPRLQLPDPEMMTATAAGAVPTRRGCLVRMPIGAACQRSLEQQYGGGQSLRGDCLPAYSRAVYAA